MFFRGIINPEPGRPEVKPEPTPIDWLIEVVAVIGLLIFLGYAFYNYPRLPENIPSHFDASGMPDDYSSRDTFWALPALSVFIYILLSVIIMIPHKFNYPYRITPSNALKQYTLAIRLIRYLKAAIVWMFFYISFATIRVVDDKENGLGLWFLPVVLGGIFIPMIFYFIHAYRKR